MENEEQVKKLIKDSLSSWGTVLDDIETVPSQYLGKSFYQMDHADIAKFFSMDNMEKFKMAYWVEQYSTKRAGRILFISGITIGIILGAVAVFILK